MNNQAAAVESSPKGQRDFGIDALRGLAILMMVCAHLAREILIEPHPFWLRAYGSVAAPLFIALSGMMVAQTASRKHHPILYYIQRGGMVLLTAALLDMLLWGLYPFVTFDVLYLIGMSIPMTALFSGLKWHRQTVILVALLGVSALLRNLLGYPEAVVSLALSDPPAELLRNSAAIVQQCFLTGWFPLFPWLFFAFLGVRLYQWRETAGDRFHTYLYRAGFPLFLLGLAANWICPSPFLVRRGYSELFYPPTASYVVAASGAVLLIFLLAGWERFRENRGLIELGQCSLLMYIVHLVLIHWVIRPCFPEVGLGMFSLLYALLLLTLVLMAIGIDLWKRHSNRPLPGALRFILGS